MIGYGIDDPERKRVGWTGTRSLNDDGREWILGIIDLLHPDTIIITGACVGADAYIARVAHDHGLYVHAIVPFNRSQVDPEWRDYCDTYDEMPDGTDYRYRNERIVDASDRMYGIADYPEKHEQSRRSGTWMTIRIARRDAKPVEVYVQHE